MPIVIAISSLILVVIVINRLNRINKKRQIFLTLVMEAVFKQIRINQKLLTLILVEAIVVANQLKIFLINQQKEICWI